ncbi:MAG: DNA primase [Chlamydiia bacterium]|nr:DNA primase [Chlamydiia bacterium]
MGFFSKESLEGLRLKVDLVEVLSPYVEMRRSGAVYKGLCPFHDEKTPSFNVQRGDRHYHCFGCGAHGDAIQFLMHFQKLSFVDAVEHLAQQFHVHLEKLDALNLPKGPPKAKLKELLHLAETFYHGCLLHTEEGHEALRYLYGRGLSLEFIRHFHIGYAPKERGLIKEFLQEKGFDHKLQFAAGIITEKGRDFFNERIQFPITDPTGATIAFSGRKFREETFGGKYVNSPETPLFKKSHTLFGLSYCRRRIAKERRAVIVEGQIDALRLIHHGLNIAVAGQGTAFGQGHADLLIDLGVHEVFLAFDADKAGREAAWKVGQLFQKRGVGVKIVPIPPGDDPDTLIQQQGIAHFITLMETATDFIRFLVDYYSLQYDVETPQGKTALVTEITQLIRKWDNALLVDESLKRLANYTRVSEQMVGVGQQFLPNVYIKQADSVGKISLNPHRILETELLRWLLFVRKSHPNHVELIFANIDETTFRDPLCQRLYNTLQQHIIQDQPTDFLSLMVEEEDPELQQLINDLFSRQVHTDKVDTYLPQSLLKILERNWMEEREKLRQQIQDDSLPEAEATALAATFTTLLQNPPKLSHKKI